LEIKDLIYSKKFIGWDSIVNIIYLEVWFIIIVTSTKQKYKNDNLYYN